MLDSKKNSKLEYLKKVTVYRKGDRVIVGEYTPVSGEDFIEEDDEVEKKLSEYKAKLKEYYDGLLSNIKDKAYSEAYQRGYEEGYKAGYQAALEKGSQKIEELVESLNKVFNEIVGLKKHLDDIRRDFQKQIDSKYEEIDKELLLLLPEVISQITYNIAGKALSVDEEFLEGYIRKAIGKLKGSEIIELRVPKALRDKVTAISDRILETDINIRKILVVEDEHIDDGIVADSKIGLVDGRLDSVIESIKEIAKEVMGYYAQGGTAGTEK